MPVPSTPADEMATQQWFILSIYRFSLSSIVYAPFHTQLEKHHKENDKLLTLCKQIFAEIFIMPRFKNHYQIWRRKKLKKRRKETDYQRRYKNEWIAPQNIQQFYGTRQIYNFFIYKNFLFITLLFVQESNKNFTVNNSFRIIKRSISFRTDFRQIMSMIFFERGILYHGRWFWHA